MISVCSLIIHSVSNHICCCICIPLFKFTPGGTSASPIAPPIIVASPKATFLRRSSALVSARVLVKGQVALCHPTGGLSTGKARQLFFYYTPITRHFKSSCVIAISQENVLSNTYASIYSHGSNPSTYLQMSLNVVM